MQTSTDILLFRPECLPFAVALAVIVGIGLLEALGLLIGAGFGHALESWLGDSAELEHLFGFLHVRKLPALVVLLCALTSFGLSGLVLQGASLAFVGHLISPLPAAGIATVFSVPVLYLSLKGVAYIVPSDETTAVPRTSFVGRIATMLQADASSGSPAQAKLEDQFGQTHYLLVEPEDDGDVLAAREEILIVRQQGAHFTAIRNRHAVLSRSS